MTEYLDKPFPILEGIKVIKSKLIGEPTLFIPEDLFDDFIKQFPVRSEEE